MTHEIYWKCALAAFIGILAHVVIVKLPSYRSKCIAANRPFSVSEYFRLDGLAILGTVVSVGAFLFAWDELIGWNPFLLTKAKICFIFIGFTGSSLLLAALSVANKSAMNLLSVKANVSDATLDKNTATVKETILKAEEAGLSVDPPNKPQ